ncbi:unnamed protein product, partial [Durusdinium trenchii]
TDSSPKAGPLNACKKRDYIRKRVSTLLAICGSIPLRTAHFRSVCLIRSRLLFTNFAFFAEPEMEGKTDSWSPEGLDSIEDIEAAIGKMDEERSGSTEVPDVPHQKPSEITMDQQRSSRSSRVVAAAVSLGQKLEQRQEIVRSSQHEWWTYKFAQVTAWVIQILFSLASLLLLVLWIRHVHPEAYVVTFFVMVIAALAYLAKVTGMGDAVIGGRKVPIIRYIDWIATTPLMLFELCMIGGAEKHTFFMVIGCDLMMLAGGIVSAMIVPKKKVGLKYLWFGSSVLFFCLMIAALQVDVANGTVKKRPADVQQLFSQLEWLTIISWTGYPIVVLLGRAHAGLISKGTEDALLCMLDCISKIGMEGFVVATCSMEGAQKSKGATEDEKNERRHSFFRSLLGELPEPLVTPQHEKGHLPFVCISDDFLDAVKSGRVKVRGRVKE